MIRIPVALLLVLACSLSNAAPPKAFFEGDVSFDPQAHSLAAEWTVSYRPDGQREARFFLNRNLDIESLQGRWVESWQSGPAQISDALMQLEVRFAEDAPLDETLQFDIRYAGKPFPETGPGDINRISPEWIELSLDAFWHPVPEGFPTDIGARAHVALPDGWQVITGGRAEQTGRGAVIHFPHPQIDLAFAAAQEFEILASRRFRVHSLVAVDDGMHMLLENSEACADYLDARFGKDNVLPPANILITQRADSGYARPGYIVLSDTRGEDEIFLAEFICHELAHYWSMKADPFGPDHWLTEAFAEYVAIMFLREHFGVAAYDEWLDTLRKRMTKAGPVWTPDATQRPGHGAMYNKAPVLLAELEARIGAENFNRWLERYMTTAMRTTQELLDALQAITDQDTREWFEKRLAE